MGRFDQLFLGIVGVVFLGLGAFNLFSPVAGMAGFEKNLSRDHCPTQDGRSLRRYARRWIVERFFAWLQWKRRLLIPWEYYAANFRGLVQLGCTTMLLRRF